MIKFLKKKNGNTLNPLRNNKVFFYSILTIGTAALFLIFRLKNVELDYEIGSLSKTIDSSTTINRELLAKRAKVTSIENLKRFALKIGLAEPQSDKIIIIP